MSVVAQPSGTVTLVFTDIEGSTRLLEELGTEAYREALAAHRRVVREACARHAGYEVDYEGDAFFYAFASAQDAVDAVSAFMVGLEGGPIRVRVGVHTGEPALDPPKYVGLDVHRAARIMSSAHGGQVVLSPSTVALLEPGAFALKELGPHRLKDLSSPIPLHQLLIEGLPQEFPPLKTLYRSNLPVPATPFLGREIELEEVVGRLLDPDTRLLTLTGPGGTGKTRLALQAAAEVSEAFPDGVVWVPLAPLRDPELVLSRVAKALELQEEPGRGLAETLSARVGRKRLLVVLDNVEHLLPDVAPAIGALRGVGHLTTLVTSRERLQLQGEDVHPVPSLAPEEAVELFTARSRSVGVEVEPGPTVAELCRRLDDLPLAIELAAARSVVFTPDQLLERLGQRLDLLKGARDADPRQQTLRATIEWSYQLLDHDEQRVFRALSVFAGGCTYDAAEQVAGADPDTLQSLLDKSLLRRRDADSGPRYWMLESIREYARDGLDAAEADGLLDRHGRWCLEFAARVRPELHGFRVGGVFQVVEADHANLRAAFDRLVRRQQGDAALRLAADLWPFWFTRDHWTEGRRILDTALSLGNADDPAARIDALIGSAQLAIWQSESVVANDRCEELLGLARRSGSFRGEAYALNLMGIDANGAGDAARSRGLLESALSVAKHAADNRLISIILNNLGDVALQVGEFERAAEYFHESLAVGEAAMDAERRSKALLNLASAALGLGDPARAEGLYRQGLATAVEIGYVDGFMMGLSGIAVVRCREDPERACRLIGCTDASADRLKWSHGAYEERLRRETVDTLRELLGEARFVESYTAGLALTLDEAAREAASVE